LRFANIEAPELEEYDGRKSQEWLEELLLNKEIEIIVNKENRVDKWGRLLGNVIFQGMDVGEQSIIMGFAKPWDQRNDGVMPDFNKILEKEKIK
jgi:endonuclease YncB( thermonuclease family)